MSVVNVRFFCIKSGFIMFITSFIQGNVSNSCRFNFKALASIFEISNISLTISKSLRADILMSFIYSFCFSVNLPVNSPFKISENPNIELIGVRNS